MDISRAKIAETFENLIPFVRRTPVIDVALPNLDNPLTLKLEMLQHAGSFKTRGAFANLLGNTAAARRGVTAASGGNHGAAVAFVAGELGYKATIFVPEISAPAKIAKIRATGAEVVVSGENYRAALDLCEQHQAETGAIAIHAYDDPMTVIGQGTMSAELETQVFDGIDTLLIAVGGGGLIGGALAWFEDRVKIVGVESEGCPTLHQALKSGEPVTISPRGLAADSLGASQIGAHGFSLARKWGAKSCLVCDETIRAAQGWLWHNLRVITEPGGATALAALLAGAYTPRPDERIAVVLCGANTTPEHFSRDVLTSQ